jgi:hypothetical protein
MSLTKVTFSMLDGGWINPADYSSLTAAIAAAKASSQVVCLFNDTTIQVPTDAGSLQDAFDYTTPASQQVQITVNIESGHQLATGLKVENGDYGQYTITSTDPIVYLANGFVGVQVETTMNSDIIAGSYAVMPTLGCLIQADDKAKAGYVVYRSSTGYVKPNCGVTHAAAFGLYVLNNSRCQAPLSNFSYSGLGNRVTTNSMLEAEGINCSNTQNRGYPDPAGDRCALDVSRGSVVNIKSQGANISNLSNSALNGLTVRRSFVSAEEINVSNAAAIGIRAEANCVVAAGASDISNCVGAGILAAFSSNVSANDCDISGCTDYGVFATNGAKVCVANSDCTGTIGLGRGVFVRQGSIVDAQNANASGSLSAGFWASSGSNINANGATCDMTGSNAGSVAVLAETGSIINCSGGTFSNSTSGQDLRCVSGSTISAVGATGAPSKTVNTVNVNGIIYQ